MDATDPAQRLHLGGAEGPVVIKPALAGAKIAGEHWPGDAELAADKASRGRDIRQLVGGNADVIELLADGEGHAVSVEQPTAPGGKHGPFGPLPPGLVCPPFSLEELELRSAGENGCDDQSKAKLNRRDPNQRLGHQRLTPAAGEGTAKSTNSESAGSWRPKPRRATGTSTSRLEATRMRRSNSARRASRLPRISRSSRSLRAVRNAAVWRPTTIKAPPRKTSSHSNTQ